MCSFLDYGISDENGIKFSRYTRRKHIIMMEKIELQQYLNRISNLIRDINSLVDLKSEDYFRHEPDMKERVYFMMQEIGRNADEVVKHYYGSEQNDEFIPLLTSLKTAQHNLVNELNDQVVYGMIKNDFPEIQKNISQKLRELDIEETML